MPFSNLSGKPTEDRLADGLVEAIITNLAKLSGLSVMAHTSALDLKNQTISLESLRQKYGATHVLRGSLDHVDGSVWISVQLIDTVSRATIWGDNLNVVVGELFDLKDRLASRITDTLSVKISPDEKIRFMHRHTSNAEALVLYHQGLILLMPPSDMTRIVTARELFRRAMEVDPEFAGGYAGAAFSHGVTVLFLKSSQSTEELENAIALGETAVDKDPAFGMGYSSLALAYALQGDSEAALKNARRAVKVQPGDAYAQLILGMSLILSGQPERAVEPLLNALRLDPAEARTPYLNVLGIAYFVTGQYASAVDAFDRNVELGGPTGPHTYLFLAAAYAELGKENQAREVLDRFLQSHAGFPAGKWISQWTGAGDTLNRTMGHLYRLGLPDNQQAH